MIIIGLIRQDKKCLRKKNKGMYMILIFVSMQLFLACGILERKSVPDTENCKFLYDTLVMKNVYPFVDEMPYFNGGTEAILKFFVINFRDLVQDQFQAKFQLEFIIDTDGKLIGARIKNKSNNELTKSEKEALRVLKIMPKWNPGRCAGKQVPVLMSLPLKF